MGSCFTTPMVLPIAPATSSSVEPTEEEVSELMNKIADEIRLEEEDRVQEQLQQLKSI